MVFWKIKGGFAFIGDSNLQPAAIKQFGAVCIIIEDVMQVSVNKRNVKSFEIVVDIQRPIGIDCVFAMAT